MNQPTLFDLGHPDLTPNFQPPAQRHSETSLAAAESIKPDANRLRLRVLHWLLERGEHGGTDEEGQEALGMPGSTYRPRRVELQAAGKIRKLETTRPTRSGRAAAVWVVVGGAK